jgi:hypothetical protein
MSPPEPSKLIVNCSAGASLAATVPGLLQQASEAALAGDAEKTANLLQLAQERTAAAAQLPSAETIVPLTADEVAEIAADQQASAASSAELEQQAATAALLSMRAKRDRWLAETDRLMLPPASMPVDTPADITNAMNDSATQKAWTTFREQLRTMFDGATDPAAFVWPAQPPNPIVLLS